MLPYHLGGASANVILLPALWQHFARHALLPASQPYTATTSTLQSAILSISALFDQTRLQHVRLVTGRLRQASYNSLRQFVYSLREQHIS
jgi:hypothetical protein